MQETLSAAAGATIDEHLQRRLEQLAARIGWTPAELIAAAIDEYVDRRDRASVPSWVGAAGCAVEARIGPRR